MKIEVEPSPKILNDLTSILTENKIIEIDYHNRIDKDTKAIRILNKNLLEEIGFGIFLMWFHDAKYRKIVQKKDKQNIKYNFINLDNTCTLFLCAYPNTKSKNYYEEIFFNDNIFNKIPTGNHRHELCPLCNLLKYNLGCLDETLSEVDMPVPTECCGDHKTAIIKWFKVKFQENESYIRMLGGDGCLVRVDPKIFQFLFSAISREENTIEQLFNSFLALYAGSLHNFDIIRANTFIISPLRSNEIDILLYNSKENKLLILETTSENAIDKKHLKHKIYNAAVIHVIDVITHSYKYITFGLEDDLKGSEGHIKLYESLKDKYEIDFDIISLPKEFDKIKDHKYRFKSSDFRKIYEYYLDKINSQLL